MRGQLVCAAHYHGFNAQQLIASIDTGDVRLRVEGKFARFRTFPANPKCHVCGAPAVRSIVKKK
jgi:hypothetical protein